MNGAVPAVRAEGLVKHYDGKDETVEAVRGVDLEIQTGEIFGSRLLQGVVLSSIIVLIALPFGITIASGPLGFLLLILLSTLWGVVYAGFMQLIATCSRSRWRSPPPSTRSPT